MLFGSVGKKSPVATTFIAESESRQSPVLRGNVADCSPGVAPLRVDIAGGGPVGLAVGALLRTYLGDQVRIRIHDPRWKKTGSRITWRGKREGNNRRRQVVTLQSNVWSSLPNLVRSGLFVEGKWSEMWPLGPDSPPEIGRPRNIRIRWIEDCLLELVQDVYDIELVPSRYPIPRNWDDIDVLAICDGPRSKTRKGVEQFSDPIPYAVKGRQLVETVLGLEVVSDLADEFTVPITVSQNRFLFNSLGGGFLNMRLSDEEAAEVVGIAECGLVDCTQSNPCVMRRNNRGFVCDTHKTVFKPSVDPTSFLWPRIQDGLRLFGVAPQNLRSITAFRLSMVHHPWCTAEIAQNSFACLLGDAANSLHFWPGRGLNTGLKSAASFARCLSSNWRGRPLRASDLTELEGVMHQLQHREKSRAWTTMLMASEDGAHRGINDRIRDGLRSPFDRAALVSALLERIQASLQRLSGRMGKLPDLEWYGQRLVGLDDSTLKVLVESEPWITNAVGGKEVSINSVFTPMSPAFGPEIDA